MSSRNGGEPVASGRASAVGPASSAPSPAPRTPTAVPRSRLVCRAERGGQGGRGVAFHGVGVGFDIEVFQTRPEALFGVTFRANSPEHPELHRLIAGTPAEPAIQEYANQARRETHADRGGDRAKTGILTRLLRLPGVQLSPRFAFRSALGREHPRP